MIRFDRNPWANLRWLDGLALVLYAGVAGATMLHHEPWADEAEAWLLARDLGWFKLVFSELRYEGHPGLWYTILWIAIHWFNAGYAALGWIGLSCAVAGAAVLIFLAPFPRPLRYLIAFSFYFLYQYAVLARSYNMLPFFAFLAAYFYRRGSGAVVPLTLTLGFLASVSVHGMVIALALALSFGRRAVLEGSLKDAGLKKQFFVSASFLSAAFVLLTILLLPASGTTAEYDARAITFSRHLGLSAAGIGYAFSTFIPVSFGIAGLLYIWAKKRHVRLVFAVSLIGNALVFGFVRGRVHHLGIQVVGSVVALWCGWPAKSEAAGFDRAGTRWNRAAYSTLCLLFAYQSFWSISAVQWDWLLPYSGAREAAEFLQSMGAHRQSVEAFDHISVAIQPYFSHNIFANFRAPGGAAFYRDTMDFRRRTTLTNESELTADWVVAGVLAPSLMPATTQLVERSGYSLMHVAYGSGFFPRADLVDEQTYLIFRRKESVTSGRR
jgi:hypothetical protein